MKRETEGQETLEDSVRLEVARVREELVPEPPPDPEAAVREEAERLRQEIRSQQRALSAPVPPPEPSPLKLTELAALSRQLFLAFQAGVPLTRALSLCRPDRAAPRQVVDSLAAMLEQGATFSEALEAHHFSPTYVQAIAVGERAGALSLVLERLDGELQRQEALRRRWAAALAYPLWMLISSLLMLVSLVLFMLPVIGELYRSLHAELPPLTRVFLALGSLLRSPAVLPVALLPISAWLCRDALARLLRQSRLGLSLDGLVLGVPVWRNRLASQMLFWLALMTEAGTRLSDALELLAQGCGNRLVAAQLAEARQAVLQGEELSCSLASCSLFGKDTLHLLRAGEEVARLSQMARASARLLDLQAEYQADVLVALLEPVLMAGLGILTGILFLAVLWPTLQLLTGV